MTQKQQNPKSRGKFVWEDDEDFVILDPPKPGDPEPPKPPVRGVDKP